MQLAITIDSVQIKHRIGSELWLQGIIVAIWSCQKWLNQWHHSSQKFSNDGSTAIGWTAIIELDWGLLVGNVFTFVEKHVWEREVTGL